MEQQAPPTRRSAALEFLFGRLNYERTATVPYQPCFLKLDRMLGLLRRLGDPHAQMPVIHVAGSKGKGSTSTMLSAVLTAAGHRTGLYTSPHLVTPEERIIVNGTICESSDFVRLLEEVRPAVEAMDADDAPAGTDEGEPTYFEILTAMAFLHFKQQKVDVAVFEVGLGGRLDSTNVCHPVVTAITSISLDHMRQLGNSLPEIAREKAGIIKSGVPVVSGVMDPASRDVIQEVASSQDAPLYVVDRDYAFEYRLVGSLNGKPSAHELMVFRSPTTEEYGVERSYQIGMWGKHQAANAAVAVATVDRLRQLGWTISDEAIATGLAQAKCAARIELVQQRPAVILDVAHNRASIETLFDTLAVRYPAQPLWVLLATTRGKDTDGLLQQVVTRADRVIATQYSDNPRSIAALGLFNLLRKAEEKIPVALRRAACECCEDARAGWELLRSSADESTVLCVTGSFFLAAELNDIVRGGWLGASVASPQQDA